MLTLLAFTASLDNGFVWDDIQYVAENQRIRSLNFHALAGMCTTYYQSNWHPLTWISHAVDYHLFGLNPSGHHLSSIILHALNCVLVFFLVIKLVVVVEDRKTDGRQPMPSHVLIADCLLSGVVTALLFSLHPLRVESVAWVAERKDLLCAFFFLCSVLSYLNCHASPSAANRRGWFACCAAFFLLALASKPMAVTLPCVLLLLDVYPLARFRMSREGKGSILLEKTPLFFVSIVSIFVTIAAQNYGSTIRTLEQMPADARILNALASLLFYVEKTVVPINLVPLYPFPKQSHWLDVHQVGAFLFVAAVTGLSLWMAKKGNYLLLVAWACYVITLSPVLGIIQVGGQAAADRYTYLPTIPVVMLMGTGLSAMLLRKPRGLPKGMRTALLLMLAGYLFLLMQATRQQVLIWRDSESLWSSVVAMFPFPESDPLVHYNLGNAYMHNGKYDQAIFEFNRTLQLQPNHARAYNNLGRIYVMQGRLNEAIAAFKQAVAVNPGNAKAYNNLGSAYLMQGDVENALSAIQRSLTIDPNNPEAHSNLAVAYYSKQEYDRALMHYEEALKQGGTVNPQLSELLKPLR
jgi:tetratricopeptide (TPR) repeat protein